MTQLLNPPRPDLEPMPPRIAALRIDPRTNYPVPWFVAWKPDGTPEFRAMDDQKLAAAVREKRCWVCGDYLGRYMTFVVGPMCGINRISAEPPSHLECARWSARNCPFLSNAKRKRREDELINNDVFQNETAGIGLTRNPGVTLLWTTRSYEVILEPKGPLFQLGEPHHIEFYANGRQATREQIMHSVETGIPILRELAEKQGPAPAEVALLGKLRERFEKLIPAD